MIGECLVALCVAVLIVAAAATFVVLINRP